MTLIIKKTCIALDRHWHNPAQRRPSRSVSILTPKAEKRIFQNHGCPQHAATDIRPKPPLFTLGLPQNNRSTDHQSLTKLIRDHPGPLSPSMDLSLSFPQHIEIMHNDLQDQSQGSLQIEPSKMTNQIPVLSKATKNLCEQYST